MLHNISVDFKDALYQAKPATFFPARMSAIANEFRAMSGVATVHHGGNGIDGYNFFVTPESEGTYEAVMQVIQAHPDVQSAKKNLAMTPEVKRRLANAYE